jgi:hypothetical protein
MAGSMLPTKYFTNEPSSVAAMGMARRSLAWMKTQQVHWAMCPGMCLSGIDSRHTLEKMFVYYCSRLAVVRLLFVRVVLLLCCCVVLCLYVYGWLVLFSWCVCELVVCLCALVCCGVLCLCLCLCVFSVVIVLCLCVSFVCCVVVLLLVLLLLL